jgi:cytochrome o ubiquinol oxidase subunit 2
VVLFLGGISWIGSHDLDPRTRLQTASTPIEVEVVSLDWKWLFIYPGLNVASVNRLVAPVGTPLHFRLTSAGVMNSFFIPQLGSQIYTMAGMATELNLQADDQGTFAGLSAQFSGDGFSDMRFDMTVVTPQAFAQWIDAARAHGGSLGPKEYAELTRPSQKEAPRTFAAVSPKLFDAILATPGTAPHETPK